MHQSLTSKHDDFVTRPDRQGLIHPLPTVGIVDARRSGRARRAAPMGARETDARAGAGRWTATDRAAGAVHWSWRLILPVRVALGDAG
jgi:hypothetical protein